MTPRDVFDRMQAGWLGAGPGFPDLLHDDAVVEIPFAAPGRPKRWRGAEFRAFAGSRRAEFPITFERCHDVVVHETADPQTIVVEYTLDAHHPPTGFRVSAQFIGVLTVRDDRVVGWREYQDTLAMTQALGQIAASAA
jgi:ketosteroid isomerase-like protein